MSATCPLLLDNYFNCFTALANYFNYSSITFSYSFNRFLITFIYVNIFIVAYLSYF